MTEELTFEDHNRGVGGLTYVYPVVSRRARGVSLGINLNTNNACNWRCVYCQVPDLVRGAAPPVDVPLLERELNAMLEDILCGDFMTRYVAAPLRRLNDIAVCGNGEPTTCEAFDRVIEVVGRALAKRSLAGITPPVIISNGSLVDRPPVLRGLQRVGELGGELWFKLDSATAEGRRRLNDTGHDMAAVRRRMALVSRRCRLRIQTMALAMDGEGPSDEERHAYVMFLASVLAEGTTIEDVMLYGFARASHQPEAPRLAALGAGEMERFADEIRALGLAVQVFP